MKFAFKWITELPLPLTNTPTATATLFLQKEKAFFLNLYVDENAGLTTNKNHPLKDNDRLPQSTDNILFSQGSPLCLPRVLFKSAFDELLERSFAGLNITRNDFMRNYYIPFLQKRLSIIMHESIDCQLNKIEKTKTHKAAILPISRLSNLLTLNVD